MFKNDFNIGYNLQQFPAESFQVVGAGKLNLSSEQLGCSRETEIFLEIFV